MYNGDSIRVKELKEEMKGMTKGELITGIGIVTIIEESLHLSNDSIRNRVEEIVRLNLDAVLKD